MKKLSILLLVLSVLVSCQQGNGYKITGKVKDNAYNDTYVYLQEMKDRKMESIDSVLISNGEFVFEGTADSTRIRFISLDEKVNPTQNSRILTVIEPGKINVEIDSTINVSGTKLNDEYNNYKKEQEEVSKKIRTLSDQYQQEAQAGTLTEESEKKLSENYESLYNDMQKKTTDFIKANADNELGKFLFINSASSFDLETQKEILAKMDDEFKSREAVRRIQAKIDNAEKVAVGQRFTDFTLEDTQGNPVSLSDYAGNGKIVLVDFWAAWCGPCRQEMPNVVAAYNKYKNKGFEVVGVSLDRERDKWLSGLKELNMTWPQMSDLKFWESPVVEMYAIRGIPHTVLLDKDGIIIEKDLRGAALDAKLKELLGE